MQQEQLAAAQAGGQPCAQPQQVVQQQQVRTMAPAPGAIGGPRPVTSQPLHSLSPGNLHLYMYEPIVSEKTA